MHWPKRKSQGLSLLEMLVAMAIMSMSLVVIYQAVGGSTRGVVQVESSYKAAMLAESLLDAYASVLPNGVQDQGQDGIYEWQVSSQPHPSPETARLHRLQVTVRWAGRELVLDTLRPERQLIGAS